jgi:copper chaperone NosL
MKIWINKITGDSEHTLQNVNILNHYIGMQFIEPDSIPELKYFPFVAIALIVLGIVFTFFKKKYVFLAWCIALIALGALGIYDFYLWEYDYGHNLSPDAPIKIPGMVYQPPLLGTKLLLNFKATSLPGLGSLGIALGVFFSFVAYIKSRTT